MKRVFSLFLAVMLLVSAVPMVYAADVDYTQGTAVTYTATGSESYTVTVPAQLAPGGNGTVTLSGTWADNRIVTVTADPTVTLTNSIKAEDQKVLNVNFNGISEVGSNTGSQTFTESVSVDNITNALFGTWSGKFNYNVEVGAAGGSESGGGTTTPTGPTFTIDGRSYQFEDGMTFGEWLNSDYSTDFPREITINCEYCGSGEQTGTLKCLTGLDFGYYAYEAGHDCNILLSDTKLSHNYHIEDGLSDELSNHIYDSTVLQNNVVITSTLSCFD